MKKKIGCYDCGKPYREFGMDVNLSRSQWMDIFPEGGGEGLLCAQCIVNRASNLTGATCIHAVIEIGIPIKNKYKQQS